MTKFICEIGSNHNQDFERTIELIREAKRAGCWGVKFQLFRAEYLYAPEFKDHIAKMKQWELPIDFIPHIKLECNKLGLVFLCTPFDLDVIEALYPYVDLFKIGSYELQWFPLIKAIVKTGKPWIFSTGMTANINEIMWPVVLGQDYNNPPYAILHCNSNYPAKPEHCNLSKIKEIKKLLDKYPFNKIQTGWSDHTRNPELVLTAIAQGAEIVEFHFDLEDGLGFETEFSHCWKPSEARAMINRAKFIDTYGMMLLGKKEWIHSEPNEQEASKWRTDPEDGLRPLKKYRKELLND